MSFVPKEIRAGDDLLAGTSLLLGHFKITATVGMSRCAFLYDAIDKDGTQVLIKECFCEAFCKRVGNRVATVSPRSTGEFRDEQKLLQTEARMLARLDHASIIGIHNIFEENGTTYIAYERIKSRPLREVMLKEPLEAEQFEEITQSLLDAVGYMHDQGVLHGSITPNAVQITSEGRVVLTQFDAARSIVTEGLPSFSMPKVSEGFSPQEFYVAGGQSGSHSDLYMLAATLYHALTGTTPPSAQMRLTAISRQKLDPYLPLQSAVHGQSRKFAAALDHAMQANPRKRTATAEDWTKMIAKKRKRPGSVYNPFAHTHSPKGTSIYRSPDQ